MIARARGGGLLAPSALGAALIIGLVAAINPLIAVGAALGVVFAFVVFADLALGFAMIAFLSFLEVLPTSGGLSLSKGAGLLLAVAWLARLSTRQRERDFFAEYPVLTWLMVAFLAWASLTLLWATQTGTGVTAISRYFLDMLLLPIAFTAVRTRRDLVIVLAAIVIGAFVAAAFGIVKPPSPEVIEGRATGTIGDPNELAAALIVGLALAAGLLLSRGRSLAVRLGGLAVIPFCAAGVFLSLSRGGLIALGALLLAGPFLAGRWRPAMACLLLVVAASGFLYFTQIASLPARERVTASNGGSGRTDLWTVGLRMVDAHPVGGVGVGNFPVASANYVLQPGLLERSELIFSTAPKVTHNTYLQVLAEMGFPGLFLFLGIIGISLICAFRAARLWSRHGAVGMEALARGVLLGLIGLLVADFFISEMYGKLLWTMLAIGPAMLAVARQEVADRSPAGD
ncbi:MAG TPA: O-antigen ligase family protein [Solirubrobacteraceae bacterium]